MTSSLVDGRSTLPSAEMNQTLGSKCSRLFRAQTQSHQMGPIPPSSSSSSVKTPTTNTFLKLSPESSPTVCALDSKHPVGSKNVASVEEPPLSSASISTQEKFVFTSTVELGPLCPKESSSPHLPASAQNEGKVRETDVILSSCPRRSHVPAVSSSHVPARTDGGGLLVKTPPLLEADRTHFLFEYCAEKANVVNMEPSALKQESHITQLLPTCPRHSRVPGLPSSGSVSVCEPSFWSRSTLDNKPLYFRLAHVTSIQKKAVNDSDAGQMTAILPSCCRNASVEGFPSASTVGLLHACPRQQPVVAGLTSRQSVLAFEESWKTLRKLIPDRRLRHCCVLVQEDSHMNREDVKCMINMLPSCPKKENIFGFPFAPQKEPILSDRDLIMSNFLPTCPRKPQVMGFPSVELDCAQCEGWLKSSSSLLKKNVKNEDGMIQVVFIGSAQILEKREWVSSAALLPSCPVKHCHLGMSSSLITSIVSLLPLCPKVAQTTGMPSLDQRGSENGHWNTMTKTLKKRVKKERQAYVVQWSPKDGKVLEDMVHVRKGCPQKTKVFGFPSAPRQEPSVVKVLPSYIRGSGILGFPSKTGLCLSSCDEWFVSKGLHYGNKSNKRQLQIGDVSYFDKNTAAVMITLLLSCPKKACIPGFPSTQTTTFTGHTTMLNLLPSCTKKSRVPGMPHSSPVKGLSEWLIEQKSFLLSSEKFVGTPYVEVCAISYQDCDVKNTVHMLPSCPPTACLPGFPSLQHQMLADFQDMINLWPACPKKSRVCGLASKLHNDADGAEWNEDKTSVWEDLLSNPGRLPVLVAHELQFGDKGVVRIMVSMLPPCPKQSRIPGIPSKIRAGAMRKEAPSMFKFFGPYPKHSQIQGLPAKFITKEFDHGHDSSDVLWEKPLDRRFGTACLKDPTDWNKDMVCMFPSCPHQALNPGFPSAVQLQGTVEKPPDMMQLLPCCPRVSHIIGFPSRELMSWDSISENWLLALTSFWQEYDSDHMDKTKAGPSIELSYANIALTSKPQLPNMVNIVPSCPNTSFIEGLPAMHVHRLAVWPRNAQQEDLTLRRSFKCIFPGKDTSWYVKERLASEPSSTETGPIRVSTVESTLDIKQYKQDLWRPSEKEDIQVVEKG